MSIAVTCPCGRTYTKPDHKIGTRFRCHLCGRELAITREAATPDGALLSPSEQPVDRAADAETKAPAPPKRRSPRPPERYLLRNAIAWLLIVFGLTLAVGGAGMAYIFSIVNEAAVKNAQAQAGMNPFDLTAPSQHKSGSLAQYGPAVFSVTVGGLLVYWGVRLRMTSPGRS
jgi:hypothetical protein